MEHIEQAGFTLASACTDNRYRWQFKQDSDLDGAAKKELKVIGLMNIQFAVVGTGL